MLLASRGITIARLAAMSAALDGGQRERTSVTIVATNPETLDGLQSYLRGAGVAARGTRDLAECTRFAADSEGKVAVIIFPDDFRWEKVVAALAELAALRPRVLPVLVTAHPQKFQKLVAAEDVIVMPRPIWGFAILDAIRAEMLSREATETSSKDLHR
jgi:hypothetical protein